VVDLYLAPGLGSIQKKKEQAFHILVFGGGCDRRYPYRKGGAGCSLESCNGSYEKDEKDRAWYDGKREV
jgi:hypothetical protein